MHFKQIILWYRRVVYLDTACQVRMRALVPVVLEKNLLQKMGLYITVQLPLISRTYFAIIN